MAQFAKIVQQLTPGVRREFLSPGKVRLILPWGFSYEAFGRNVVVQPWSILHLMESAQSFSFNSLPGLSGGPFLKMASVYTTSVDFVGSMRLTVAKEMYDVTIPKTPLTLESELVYVGKSSFNVHSDVVLPSQQLNLASCEVQSVMVDLKTHRPAPFPDWWRAEFGGFSAPERQLRVNVQTSPQHTSLRAQSPDPASASDEGSEVKGRHASQHGQVKGKSASPHGSSHPECILEEDQDLPMVGSVSCFDTMITTSVSDANGHANWTSYLKYCLDAMMMGTGSGVRHSLPSPALKSADVAFLGEGSVGQRITVQFWTDGNVARTVCFNIVDRDSSQLLAYAAVQFYSVHEVRLPVVAGL